MISVRGKGREGREEGRNKDGCYDLRYKSCVE
jgi:hypothetical protein